MASASKTDNFEDSIKAELEHVYVMASYVDTEQGRFDVVKHLVSAAIDEMESLIEEPLAKHPRPIRRNSPSVVRRIVQR